MEQLTLVAPTLFGLEGVCAEELKRLDARNVRAENGRVLWDYTPESLVRANLCLRTGERVMLRLGRFPAPDFDALYDGTCGLPWEEFIPREGAFPIRCRSVDSRLTSQQRCGAVVKAAVGDRLGRAYGLEHLPETGAEYAIRLFIMDDMAELYLDASGPSLHKRGYRAMSVVAPLRETIAAGMVLLSRYRGKGAFRDPFCGSGTIPIESEEGSHAHLWAAKLRSSPGARFLAMRAASMGMVPEPQKGSHRGSRPLYRDRRTSPAARVSRRGAATPWAR